MIEKWLSKLFYFFPLRAAFPWEKQGPAKKRVRLTYWDKRAVGRRQGRGKS